MGIVMLMLMLMAMTENASCPALPCLVSLGRSVLFGCWWGARRFAAPARLYHYHYHYHYHYNPRVVAASAASFIS